MSSCCGFRLTFSAFVFCSPDPYGGVAGYPSAVGYGSAVSPTSNGHFAMPPCPPVATLPGAGTVAGRGSVIQAAAANCYQPNGAGPGAANLNDLYYMDFGAPTAAAAAAMYHHQKAAVQKNNNNNNNNNNNINNNNCNGNKKPKKYGAVGRPAAVGSPGATSQSSCPATGPKRKSREGKNLML